MKYEIDRAGFSDILQINRIEKATFPTPWSLYALFSDILLAGDTVYLCAREGRRVIGYAGMRVSPHIAHITNVAVVPERRRQGIAGDMLLRLARGAAAAGCAHIALEVRESNAGAQELYRKYGYRTVDRREEYYRNPVEDALIMARDLP